MSDIIAPEVRKHTSGLRTQAVTGPYVSLKQRHTVEIPPCCPISGNPQTGSTLSITYRPAGWCIGNGSVAVRSRTRRGGQR